MRTGRWLIAIPIVLFLLGVVVFLGPSDRFNTFPLDDAWIHQVYARAFASGHGFAYNPGAQEAGATSPLWVIVTAPVHWFEGGNPHVVVAGVMLIEVLLAIVALLLFASIATRVTGSRLTACIAASLLAIDPRLLFSALSGMETMLVVTLWLGAVRALMARNWWLAAAAFALMPLARPECLVILPVAAVALFVPNHEWTRRRKILPPLVLGVPFALWALFCHRINGHWLPNTYYLKSHGFHLSGAILINAWHIVSGQGFGAVFLFPIGILIAAFEQSRRCHWVGLLMSIAAPLVYVFAVAGTRELINDGYYWTRWLDPPALILTITFALGVAFLVTGSVTGIPEQRAWRVATIVAGVIALAACAPRFAHSWQERRDRLATDSRAIGNLNVAAGRWIHDHTPATAMVAVKDAGALRYFGNRYTVDLAGINNHDIAFEKVARMDAMLGCDWLAIFPMEFEQQEDVIRSNYDATAVFRVTPAEYTICHCPRQTTLAILHKKNAP